MAGPVQHNCLFCGASSEPIRNGPGPSPSLTNSGLFPPFFTRRAPETRVVARGGEEIEM